MTHPGIGLRANLEYLEEAYTRWQHDPHAVEPTLAAFFEGLELGGASPLALLRAEPTRAEPTSSPDRAVSPDDIIIQNAVMRLIDAYRDLGHQQAHLDPLSPPPPDTPHLALCEFGLSERDLDRIVDPANFQGMPGPAPLRELIAALKETYCRTIGVEFRHIQDMNIRRWFRDHMEPHRNRPNFQLREQYRILLNLHFAELFERFLQNRYLGQKRFSLEGAETLIAVLDALVEKAPELGVQEYIIGMAHRGRLNVLANILQKPYQEIFAEFEDHFQPDAYSGDGDVKYHLGFSSDRVTTSGGTVHLSLSPNPSHLEAVDPVVLGRTRAKQQLFGDYQRSRGVPILIHGDAAFAGQGSVAETFNLSALEGYTVGGTIHIIVNNQIGFTTNPCDARSTPYCTDVAKMVQAPIFHVNADDPEAAVYVAQLALAFRQQFKRDVVIDLYCYRRHGHNETDEPMFTQPVMYQKIRKHPSPSAAYTERLIQSGALKPEEARAIDEEFQMKLQEAQIEVRSSPPRKRGMRSFTGRWDKLQARYNWDPVDTTITPDMLRRLVECLTTLPEGFTPHPKIAKLLESRRELLTRRQPIDWSYAELLAFGGLILEGTPVRLSGQDSRRGTFSQRHAAIYDVNNGQRYVPLDTLRPDVPFHVFDSQLSEFAVLGFEYGYSTDEPFTLVLWEAQFGDFANGAQVIIDQFIVSGESKWQRSSGLVLLLPHGYEGQGPEHSSARPERFLQACAEENIQVANLTTPAQYFHILRRQMKRNFRKPLVIMTPKSLLRRPEAVSYPEDLTAGRFHEVLDDPSISDPATVERLLFCSGKLYYELVEERARQELEQRVAIVRLEQLYPWPEDQLRVILKRYAHATTRLWAQEESQNMGAWSFVEPRLRAMGYEFGYVGRDASASPATGSYKVHEREQRELVMAAIGGQTADVAVQAANGTIRTHGKAEPAASGSAPAKG